MAVAGGRRSCRAAKQIRVEPQLAPKVTGGMSSELTRGTRRLIQFLGCGRGRVGRRGYGG